jgi:hypothetical protein
MRKRRNKDEIGIKKRNLAKYEKSADLELICGNPGSYLHFAISIYGR